MCCGSLRDFCLLLGLLAPFLGDYHRFGLVLHLSASRCPTSDATTYRKPFVGYTQLISGFDVSASEDDQTTNSQSRARRARMVKLTVVSRGGSHKRMLVQWPSWDCTNGSVGQLEAPSGRIRSGWLTKKRVNCSTNQLQTGRRQSMGSLTFCLRRRRGDMISLMYHNFLKLRPTP